MGSFSKILQGLILTAISSTPVFAAWAEVQGWIIDSGDTGCYLWAEFESGTSFMIDIDSSVEPVAMDISIWNTKWRSIEVDREYMVSMLFDNGNRWDVTFFGTTFDDGSKLLLNTDDATSVQNRSFVNDFVASDELALEFDGTSIDLLNIEGSKGAFREMVACHKSLLTSGEADPFASADPFN